MIKDSQTTPTLEDMAVYLANAAYTEWDEKTDGPHPTEKVFYIQNLDGNETRWTNASFLAIPTQDILP